MAEMNHHMAAVKHRVQQEGQTTHLFLEGEIDMRLAPELRKILHGILSRNPPELVVDLGGVPFIDSSGVATLVEALRLQMKDKRTLKIKNPTEAVRYTFKITQLTKVFGIEEISSEKS